VPNRAHVRWGKLQGIDLVLEDRAVIHLNGWGATVVGAELEWAGREGTEPEVELRNGGALVGTLTRGRAREVGEELLRKAAIERMMHPKSGGG